MTQEYMQDALLHLPVVALLPQRRSALCDVGVLELPGPVGFVE